MKKLWLTLIGGYQYLSKMLPGSCRYYPTCSEYAKWQFETTAAHRALPAMIARILRCNQLFEGGIDFPKIVYSAPHRTAMANQRFSGNTQLHPLPTPNPTNSKITIKYWIIPIRDPASCLTPIKYYIVTKDFDATNTH